MATLTDQNRNDFEAMILDVDQLDPALVDGSYDVPAPDPASAPTQEDVDGAAATVMALEKRQNDLRGALEALRERFSIMTYFYGAYGAITLPDDDGALPQYRSDQDLVDRFDDARRRLRTYIDEVAAAEQLLTQLLDHWRSALAVLEHDLKWQAYVADAFGITETPRRSVDIGTVA